MANHPNRKQLIPSVDQYAQIDGGVHGPTPWIYDESRQDIIADGIAILSVNCSGVADEAIDANGYRVAACVNACDGIANEDLIAWTGGRRDGTAATIDTLRTENERLREACKQFLDWADRNREHVLSHVPFDRDGTTYTAAFYAGMFYDAAVCARAALKVQS